MGRPRKIDYTDPDDMPPVRVSHLKSDGQGGWSESRAALMKARSNEGYKLGDEWLSETGHKVIVTGVGADEVTFGFTRTVKGDPERRERSVPLSQIEFFLKSYKPA